MRRRTLSLLVALLCLALALAPLRAGEAPATITVGVPQAPPALPILRMIDSGAMRDRATIALNVWNSPEQLIAMALDGEHDMFIMPLTVAARLHNKGVGVRLTNITTWGIAHLITSDPGVSAWADLAGKTLFVPMRSSTSDVLTRYFLHQAGLEPERDVRVAYLTMAEMGRLLAAGRIDNAVLLEPQVTAVLSANPALRIAFSFADEWKRIKGAAADIPNAGLGATTAFLDANPDLAREFEAEYAKAVAWILEHPGEAGVLAREYLGLRAETIADAVPRLGLRYVSAGDAAGEVDALFRLLHDFSPELIGKTIPDATLYWE